VDDLEAILMHLVVDEVFIGLPIKSLYEEIQRTFAACERVGVPAKYPTDLFRTTLAPPRLEQRVDTPLIAVTVAPDDYRLVIKRVMDVVGAAVLLILCAPLILAIAVAVKLTSPGPVFFAHERYGYMKRRFRMYKFRTMVSDAEEQQPELEARNEAKGPVFKIRDDPRMTRLGKWLRRGSLDELPQLWHVLKGEMSLAGPRPMSLRDVSLFEDPWLMRRFSVRPGITGLWQVSGRSSLTFDRWMALDLEYIDQWSLLLDLKLLARTIPAVIGGRGAS
jgi:exopolysaccharide biosynthesis polyprenyl glycosylphosphotransferase